jgi:hypothetical protein
MTVSSTTSKAIYSGNGLTTSFAVPFYFLAVADLQVILRSGTTETVQALTTNYTVSGAGNEAGGTVTMLVAPASGTTLTIRRSIAATQGTDLLPNDRLPAEDLEDGLDKLTMIAQQLGEESDRSIKFPASDAAVSAQLPAASARASKFLTFDANGVPTATVGVDATTDVFIQSGTGAVPRSVTAKLQGFVSVKDFGATGDGVTNDTAAVQVALSQNVSLLFEEGTYRVDNLTWAANSCRMIALGRVRLVKRANGPILTITGSDNVLEGIEFRGESGTPVFTGDNLVISGDNTVLQNCGARWAFGRAVKCTGQRLRIFGSCDIYQTSDATASGYDIEIGVAGVANLYSVISGIQSTQATGGILLTAPGFTAINDCQFGKLTVQPGSSPGGMHGPSVSGCRINGAITIDVSNTFLNGGSCSANVSIGTGASSTTNVLLGDTFSMIAGSTLTFGANAVNNRAEIDVTLSSVTVVNNGLSNAINRSPVTYAPSWTASGTNPTIGNGTIFGDYGQEGRSVTANITLTIGSTTNLGSGVWSFSLPVARWAGSNATSIGVVRVFRNGVAFYVGAAQLFGGASVVTLIADGSNNSLGSAVPFAWASGDVCAISIVYFSA